MKIDDQDKITHLKLKCLSSKYHHLAKTCEEGEKGEYHQVL